MLIQTIVLLSAACLIRAIVLDPAMYLAPAPPLSPARADLSPGQRWTQAPAVLTDPSPGQRWTQQPVLTDPSSGERTPSSVWSQKSDALDVIPLVKMPSGPVRHPQEYNKELISEVENDEDMQSAQTFWPFASRTFTKPTYSIPITYGITGTYGGYNSNPGVVASSYMSATSAGSTRGLAGYGYSGPGFGTRVYGRTPGSWTGWGNGPWGHYGQG